MSHYVGVLGLLLVTLFGCKTKIIKDNARIFDNQSDIVPRFREHTISEHYYQLIINEEFIPDYCDSLEANTMSDESIQIYNSLCKIYNDDIISGLLELKNISDSSSNVDIILLSSKAGYKISKKFIEHEYEKFFQKNIMLNPDLQEYLAKLLHKAKYKIISSQYTIHDLFSDFEFYLFYCDDSDVLNSSDTLLYEMINSRLDTKRLKEKIISSEEYSLVWGNGIPFQIQQNIFGHNYSTYLNDYPKDILYKNSKCDTLGVYDYFPLHEYDEVVMITCKMASLTTRNELLKNQKLWKILKMSN